MRISAGHGSLFMSSNVTSTMKGFSTEEQISSCHESGKALFLSLQILLGTKDGARTAPCEDQRLCCSGGGESPIRLRLCKRLFHLVPVAQRTGAPTIQEALSISCPRAWF